ncbi:hypothetical protein [Tritonibacter sp. SIMBA_163]|uniref:hypothetical protein n=1 Tax=Tritonibacter sp. SIMBA_163 TaxID=3080868 RepID=UPI0039817AE6
MARVFSFLVAAADVSFLLVNASDHDFRAGEISQLRQQVNQFLDFIELFQITKLAFDFRKLRSKHHSASFSPAFWGVAS